VGKIVVGGLIFSLVSIIGVLIYQCRKKV
jgi:hypothetical protein